MASCIQPLFLPSKQSAVPENVAPQEVACIFCDDISFLVEESCNYQNVLKHLLSEHKFVISKFAEIADPPKYLEYWRKRFQGGTNIADVCAVIRTNTGEDDAVSSEDYYLLSEKLPEDASIRADLRKLKLIALPVL